MLRRVASTPLASASPTVRESSADQTDAPELVVSIRATVRRAVTLSAILSRSASAVRTALERLAVTMDAVEVAGLAIRATLAHRDPINANACRIAEACNWVNAISTTAAGKRSVACVLLPRLATARIIALHHQQLRAAVLLVRMAPRANPLRRHPVLLHRAIALPTRSYSRCFGVWLA